MDNLISDNDKLFEKLDKLYDEDKFDDVIKEITKVPQENRSNKLLFMLIGAYSSSEKYGEALRELEQIFERCETNEDIARYWYQRGYICYKTDHEFAAKHLYERGLEAAPDDPLDLKSEIEECNSFILDDLHKLADISYRAKTTIQKHCASGMGRVKYRLSDEEFSMRLSFLSAIRQIPGTKLGLGFSDFLKTYPDKEKPVVREFLKQRFKITDKKSLDSFINNSFSYNLAFLLHNVCANAAGTPDFDLSALDRNGRELFEDLTVFFSYIARYLPERGGVAAWDICEKIGFARSAFACGIINEKDYRSIVNTMTNFAKDNFSSFEEYLTSLVIGSGTFMFVEDNRSVKSAIRFIDQMMPLILVGDVADVMWNGNN
ncbi:MAG: DUF1266 domain-containing protein [Oscillospiraceae bacterium]|nr:DUF1266 domain-containing protein [Oscillospiraceae bacterium]